MVDQLSQDRRAALASVWDLGPKRPVAPVAPAAPVEGKAGKNADFALATIEFEDALGTYKEELRAYGVAKKHYEDWKRNIGGPIELAMNTVLAREAMTRDPERYVDRLPKGVKPGRADAASREEAARRQAQSAKDASKDPHFGDQNAHAA